MNRELLERVKAHIIEEPRRFFMALVIAEKRNDDDVSFKYPSCGTLGCFAGWAYILSGHSPKENLPRTEVAQHALGIDNEQAHRLFFESPENWSKEDSMKLWSCDGTPETAALAARRIDEFIASDGAV